MDYAKQDSGSQDIVPKVHLHATDLKALDVVSMEDLKKYTAEPEAANASSVPQDTKDGLGGAIKEMSELAGKDEMTSWDESGAM
jgi:hypothetical protein